MGPVTNSDHNPTMLRRCFLGVGLAAAGCNVAQMHHRVLTRRFDRRGFESRVVTSGNDTISGWVHPGPGSGRPLVLVHGFGGAPLFQWQHQLRPASGWGPVAVPQLLWLGESTSTDLDPSLTHQARATWAWLDAMKLDNPILVGVSYGGFVSLEMSRLRPRGVDALVMVDSPGTAWTRADHTAMLSRFDATTASEIFVPHSVGGVQQLLSLAVSRKGKLCPGVARDVLELDYDPQRAELVALLDYLETNLEALRQQTLERVPPTRVVWGADDRVFPPDAGRRFAQQMSAGFTLLPNTRHLAPADSPEQFNDVLREFVASQRGG